LGISGIAGPDGGSDEKPVGTVWISVFNGKKHYSRKFLLGDNRERNITRASISALNMLRVLILEDIQKK
jgi:nicotinamide-nucleotide amidase